jgi:dethiobiotin synthetase
LEHASYRGLRVLGYVLNHLEQQPSLAAETNAEALRYLTAVPCLGEIPYIEESTKQSLVADFFEERLGPLLQRMLLYQKQR